MRSAQHDYGLRVLEMLIPGVLQRRKHRRISLGRVGQFVKDQQPTLHLELCGDRLPEIRPTRERWCPSGCRVSVDQAGEQLSALHGGGCFFCHPVRKRCAALLGSMPQQCRFPHPPPSIQHHQLAWPRMLLVCQHSIQKRKLGNSVNKHIHSSYYLRADYHNCKVGNISRRCGCRCYTSSLPPHRALTKTQRQMYDNLHMCLLRPLRGCALFVRGRQSAHADWSRRAT